MGRKTSVVVTVGLLVSLALATPKKREKEAAVGRYGKDGYLVATGQILSPAGTQMLMAGRIFDLALSPDGRWLATKMPMGITLWDTKTQKVHSTLKMPISRELAEAYRLSMFGVQSFVGLEWDETGSKLYCTDAHGQLLIAKVAPDGQMAQEKAITLPGSNGKGSIFLSAKSSAPGGIAVDPKRNRLYVSMSRNNTIGVIDQSTYKIVQEIPVGVAPFDLLVKGDLAYVSNWGGRRPRPGDRVGYTAGSEVVVDEKNAVPSTGSVTVIDLNTGSAVREIETGLHPSSMASDTSGRVYVANANSDSITVIDSQNKTSTISTKPSPDLPPGMTPTALFLSPDERTRYVALAGLNAVGLIDLQKRSFRGIIPVGWYPIALASDPKAKMFFAANLKGIGARAPEVGLPGFGGNDSSMDSIDYFAETKEKRKKTGGYNSHDSVASVSAIPFPDSKALANYTHEVSGNNNLPELKAIAPMEDRGRPVPVPRKAGERSVFKHVIYIIKENRTYDSVFGDMPQGNGDPRLCLFPRKVSPNHHALAEEFVLLDNLYCNGELSAEGHMWATQGTTTDYTERATGGFGRGYSFEGSDALTFAQPGFLWDQVLAKNLTLRIFGEFALYPAEVDPSTPSDGILGTWRRDIYDDAVNMTNKVSVKAATALHTIRPHMNMDFAGFDMTIPDIHRTNVFLREFHEYEKKGEMPNMIVMLLGSDHTAAMRPGFPSPQAMVADNDVSLGRIVEAVSKSQFWKDTAIFVVEDDPQDGLDHVDGRRTVGLVISPYTKRKSVNHTFYNQNSLLRTMQLILGLPPLTHFDLITNPMHDLFQAEPDLTPYTVRPAEIPLDQLNKPVAELRGKARTYAQRSLAREFLLLDAGDEEEKNRILWYSVRGNAPYPRMRNTNNDD